MLFVLLCQTRAITACGQLWQAGMTGFPTHEAVTAAYLKVLVQAISWVCSGWMMRQTGSQSRRSSELVHAETPVHCLTAASLCFIGGSVVIMRNFVLIASMFAGLAIL